jgi:hypothetical protein
MVTRTATPEQLGALCDGFIAVLIATLVLAGTRPAVALREPAPGSAGRSQSNVIPRR